PRAGRESSLPQWLPFLRSNCLASISTLEFHSALCLEWPQQKVQSGFSTFLPVSIRTSRNRLSGWREIPRSGIPRRNIRGCWSVLIQAWAYGLFRYAPRFEGGEFF